MSLSKPHKHADGPTDLRMAEDELDQHVREAHTGWTVPPTTQDGYGWTLRALHDADHEANADRVADWAPTVGGTPRASEDADLMLTVANDIREEHDQEHPRFGMWTRLADVLMQAAPMVSNRKPVDTGMAREIAYNLLGVARQYQEAQKAAIAEDTRDVIAGSIVAGEGVSITLDEDAHTITLSHPRAERPREEQCKYDGLPIIETRRWTWPNGGAWQTTGWRHYPGWTCLGISPKPVGEDEGPEPIPAGMGG